MALLLSFGGIVVLQAAPAAAATSISVSKSAPSSVLVGAPITYSLTASNPAESTTALGDADFQYNVSFRDVLPAGVAYVSTSAPAGLADPQQIPERDAQNALTGRTILIWSNVGDLPDGSDITVRYTVKPDAAAYPTGGHVDNQATGYASSNERRLAKFTAQGAQVADPVISSASDTATTTISALELQKTEPSPEHELVRGVHDRPTVYGLKVTNNGERATNGVTVVDYLPAGLEFLGCGGVDNSAAGTEEYPGSGRLTGTPAVSGCLTPSSVTTVDSGLPTGYPAGVYTRVEWHLPADLGINDTFTIKYAAGIPMKQNVMPTGTFTSTANLDNNTGASTRETTTERAYTNRATASGRYQGPDLAGTSNTTVTASTTLTVQAEDLALVKSVVDSAAFDQGGEATFNLQVRSSEYADGSGIELVDTLPDGLCPSDATADVYSSAALAQAGSGECKPVASGGNPAIAVVDFVDGTYVITFAKLDLSADQGSRTVSHQVRMRTSYNDEQEETSAGDSYTNKVALTGTTTPIAGTSEAGTRDVKDDSQATMTSGDPTLDKRILRNTGSPYTCDDDSDGTWNANGSTGDWRDTQAAADDEPFTAGSRVCFQVRVVFPASTSTRLPVVADYLPDNLAYEPGSFQLVGGVNTAPFTVDQSALTTAFATGSASLRPGTDVGSKRYVERGKVFAFRLSAIVQDNPAAVVDVQGNLAKLRWTNRAGRVSSLRDTADFRVPPTPPVTLRKQVAKLATPTALASSQTGLRHGDTLHYVITATHGGSVALGSDDDLSDVKVWDALPVGFRCANVVGGTSTGTCTDPGQGGHPSFSGNDTLSAIVWTVPTLQLGTPRNLSYDLTVPTSTAAGVSYPNTAAVRSFTTPTNRGTVSATHYPEDNVDTTVTPAMEDTPAAADLATITISPVVLTKTNDSTPEAPTPAPPFNGAHDAVPGEVVTYTVRAAIPAHTRPYNGVLTDPLPSGMTAVAGGTSAGYSATGAQPATDPLPAGTTLDSATGTLTLPKDWLNDSSTTQVFEVRIKALVPPGSTATTVRNQATFTSKTVLDGVVAAPGLTATSDVAIVHPAPSLAKNLTGNATVSGGDTRQFTLVATNAASRPPSYDTKVVDCVPEGLTVTVLPAAATQAAGDGTSCPTAATLVTWNVGTLLAGTPQSLTYTVKVSDQAVSQQTYVNSASIVGSSLDDGGNVTLREQVVSPAPVSKTLTVNPATVSKSIATNRLTIGERASYTVTATIPANVTLYDAAVLDTLPVGFKTGSLRTASITCSPACSLPVSDGLPASPGTNLTVSGSTVGWLLGDLAPSTQVRTVVVTYSAEVDNTCQVAGTTTCNTIGKTRANSVRLRWNKVNGANDPTSADPTKYTNANTTAATQTYTILEPATAITKSVDVANPVPGQTFTYTVTASNTRATNVSDAFEVAVKDVVPTGVVVDPDSLTAGGGTLTGATANGGGTITWPNIPVLTATGAGGSKSFTYSAKLAPSASIDTTGLQNTAAVTGYASLATGGRTYTSGPTAKVTVNPKFPHVSVQKRVVDSPVAYVGEPTTFEVVVTSDGAAPAYDVDVTDVLPKNWDFGTANVKVGDADGAVLAPASDDGNPETVTWDNLAHGGLAAGKTIVITYTATPKGGATGDAGAGSSIGHVNTVSVSAEDATDATANKAGSYRGAPATATARIQAADLEITKSGVGTPVAGKAYSWKIAVDNVAGDTAAGDIVVTDPVPDGVTDFGVSGEGWTCSSTTTTWTCAHAGSLTVAAAALELTATGTIPADTAGGTTIANTATVTAHTYDPVAGNNEATATTKVTALADLAIRKSLAAGELTAGQNATYTLDVTNLGPSVSRGPITVEDTLPEGTTFVSADGSDWDCARDGGVVTCTRAGDLAVSASAPPITITVAVPAARTADVTNSAVVSGTTPEPDTQAAKANDKDSVTTTPTRTASLLLEKSRKDNGTFIAGASGTYILSVRNAGPSTATGVTIKDALPDYLTYTGATGAGWTCAAPTHAVTCDLAGSLAVDGEKSVEITVKVAAGHVGEVANEAEVTATEDPSGADDGDVTSSDQRSDLSITKHHTGDAVAGTSLTYDLEIANEGASDTAGPLEVSDFVPNGMTYTSSSGAGWSCDEDDGVVTCTHEGGLAAGAAALDLGLTFDVAEDAGPADGVLNVATVTGPNTDPDLSNNSASDPTTIVDEANVTITKKRTAETVDAGGEATWTIGVTNDGPSTADNVHVLENLPDGLSIVSIEGDGWTCSTDAPVGCTRTSLPVGDAPDITAVTKLGSGIASGTTITNAATVSASVDTDEDDNDAKDSITTAARADLTLDKSHTDTAVAGDSMKFSLVASNAGPSDAQGPITITDELPAGLRYVSANPDWSCDATEVDASDPQDVVCTLVSDEPVVAGEDAPKLVMTVGVGADRAGVELENSASVESATPDPTDDNSDTDTVTPDDDVDLSITKSHVGPVEVGQPLTFTLGVHNDGLSEAQAVSVADELPTGLTFVSASGDGWDCDDEATCTLDDPLGPGADAEPITVVADVTAAAFPGVTNTATVSTSSDDKDEDNDTADDEVVVPAKVDLSLVKSLQGTLKVGKQATYSLAVHNAGPTADPGTVTVSDQLPAGLSYVSASATGWSCDADSGLVTCDRPGGLAVDATDVITLTVEAGAAAYPSVTNTATVGSPAVDTDPDNNSSSVTEPVEATPGLSIEKDLADVTGAAAAWTITVVNAGPTETAEPVVVTDKLPAGLRYSSAKGEGWACDDEHGTITCTYADPLPVGGKATIRVSTAFVGHAGRVIVNSASVSAGDAAVEDPTDDAQVTVPRAVGPAGSLPDTGGAPLWLLLLGLGAAAAGTTIVARRQPAGGRHR